MIDLHPEDLGGETGEKLLNYIRNRRWFGQKSLAPESIKVLDIATLDSQDLIFILILEIGFHEGGSALYSFPLAISLKEEEGTIASIDFRGLRMFLCDAFFQPAYTKAMILGIAAESEIKGMAGTVKFSKTGFFRMPAFQEFETVKSEQSNSSSIVDRGIIVKNYRYLQSGENPDLEMALALRVRSGFSNVPMPMGYAVYEGKGMRLYLAGCSEFLDGSVDAWSYYTGKFISLAEKPETFPLLKCDIVRLGEELGGITGSMHRSLSHIEEGAFRPEPVQLSDLHDIVTGSLSYIRECFELLKPYIEKNEKYTERFLKIVGKIHLNALGERMLSGLALSGMKKIRVHGDYHLGQILIWRDSFYIIDFEGEPVRSMEERRKKQSPMKDLAGIIRSMDYLVSYIILKTGNKRLAKDKEILLRKVRETLIDSYRKAFTGCPEIFSDDSEKFNELLDLYILEKASYELLYEINNRPAWIEIPLIPVMDILESSTATGEDHKGSA
ncbi:hypothetical protein OXIME_000155 [Oxyplasma meridianum]|uniref:Maltokinase n=1 Tax=Oxyplasma meridianum TaxID=3073602 RepID=A0AAX4NDS7_9ARCH